MKRLLIFVALSAYAVCGMAMTKGDTNYLPKGVQPHI